MKWISDSNILIVGLGLMGGSYAMALKRLGYHVTAISRRWETIDYAMENGIIDYGSAETDEKLISNNLNPIEMEYFLEEPELEDEIAKEPPKQDEKD